MLCYALIQCQILDVTKYHCIIPWISSHLNGAIKDNNVKCNRCAMNVVDFFCATSSDRPNISTEGTNRCQVAGCLLLVIKTQV